jgi:hypothetical protein
MKKLKLSLITILFAAFPTLAVDNVTVYKVVVTTENTRFIESHTLQLLNNEVSDVSSSQEHSDISLATTDTKWWHYFTGRKPEPVTINSRFKLETKIEMQATQESEQLALHVMMQHAERLTVQTGSEEPVMVELPVALSNAYANTLKINYPIGENASCIYFYNDARFNHSLCVYNVNI